MLCNYKGCGLQNCYITLYDGGGVKKINIFALYNIWTAPCRPCIEHMARLAVELAGISTL